MAAPLSGSPLNITLYDEFALRNTVAFPSELFYFFCGIAVIFLILAVYYASNCKCRNPDGTALFAFLSGLTFWMCAYMIPGVAMIALQAVTVTNTSQSAAASIAVIPTIYYWGRGWMIWYLIIMGFISFLVSFYGTIQHFRLIQEIKEGEKEKDWNGLM